MATRPPYLAMPYPLDEYLDQLPGDYGKVARALLRASNWERGPSRCSRYQLDAGEALMDERSEALWGSFRLDRDVTAAGRRALVRRVLERLERDGWAARRAAQGFGPSSSPRIGPRNGPIPTVVRWLKFREILWPASVGTAQETAQRSAQETALANGPILPASPPAPPAPVPRAGAREDPPHVTLAQRSPSTEATGCDEWGQTLAFLTRNVRADIVARFYAGLRGRMVGNTLVLLARSEFAARFLNDEHLETLRRAAAIALGRPVEVVVEGPPAPPVAAGGAR